MMPAPPRRVAGFTFFEALVTLAITGLAMSLVLSVGMRGVATAFRLGGRAIDRANSQVSLQAVRDTIDSLVLPPIVVSSAAAEAEVQEAEAAGQGDSFEGEPMRLAGYIIAARDTPCAPLGGQGRLTLSLVVGNGRTLIQCQLGDADAITVANLAWPDAHFTYSEDGSQWSDTWTVVRGETVETATIPDAEQRRVYVRISSQDGADQLVALATSGRAIPLAAGAVG